MKYRVTMPLVITIETEAETEDAALDIAEKIDRFILYATNRDVEGEDVEVDECAILQHQLNEMEENGYMSFLVAREQCSVEAVSALRAVNHQVELVAVA